MKTLLSAAALVCAASAFGAQAPSTTWTVTYHDLQEVNGKATWWTNVGEPIDISVRFTGADANTNGLIDREEVTYLAFDSVLFREPFSVYPIVSYTGIHGTAMSTFGQFSYSIAQHTFLQMGSAGLSQDDGLMFSSGLFDFLTNSATFEWDTTGAPVTVEASVNPVPEPQSLILMALGIVGVTALGRLSPRRVRNTPAR